MFKGLTISDATHKWVSEFNAIPREMIERLMLDHREDWQEITVMTEEQQEYYSDMLPMWGTMWSFGDGCDDWWLENEGGIEIMSKCGFRIYEHDEWGYFFGIDGAGYDFYAEHWIPLYKMRGLQWHDPAAEKEATMLRKGYHKGKLGGKQVWLDENDSVITEV